MIKPTDPIEHTQFMLEDIETDAYILKSPIHGRVLRCLVNIENGWEHVSVCSLLGVKRKPKIPVWIEMCTVKNSFWFPDQCVMQLHVPQKDWVNYHKHILHLWRPIYVDIPQPDPSEG